MIAIIRILLLAVFIIVSGICGLLLCIVRPFHANNVHTIAKWYGYMSKLIGVELVITQHENAKHVVPAMYVANHQNNYDLFTLLSRGAKKHRQHGEKKLKVDPVLWANVLAIWQHFD